MYAFKFSAGDINVDTEFRDRVCYLLDNSGTGKTYLFMLIYNYCKEKKIDAVYFNYLNMDFSENTIIGESNNQKIVIFDNADLYLTDNIVEKINADLILVSIKDIEEFNVLNSGRYHVKINDKTISVKRW
jgi:ABC-type ATPase involved in cell division